MSQEVSRQSLRRVEIIRIPERGGERLRQAQVRVLQERKLELAYGPKSYI